MEIKTNVMRVMEIATPLGPDVLLFHRMRATEELSRPAEYQLDLLSLEPDINLDEILGQCVTVKLGLPDSSTRYFSGYVTRFAQGGSHGRFIRYSAVVRSWLWFLTRTADCRIFQDMTVPDIVKTVFADHSTADFKFELTGDYRTWTYCVQYRETDFNFISRLLEEEGIYSERRLHGRLPGVRPRLFVERDHQRSLSEVPCRLRTVVFLPDADAVVQIWQGTTPIGDEDASELTHVLAGLEAIDRPRDETHYAQVMARRLDEQNGMLAMLNDADLLPNGLTFETLVPADVELNKPPAPDSFRGRKETKHRREIEAARAEASSLGLDPDGHAPPLPGPREPVPPPHLLGEHLREFDRKAQAQIRASENRKQRMFEETAAEFAARGESFDDVLKELAGGPAGPPKPRAPALLEHLQKRRAELLSRNTDIEEVGLMVSEADLHERWQAADRSAQQMYEQAAHFKTAAPRAEGQKAEAQRQWVAERLAAGAPIRGFDLTGADLRGIDLRGANLDGAMMESACLDGVDLRGATARGTVLAHASFDKARADDCDFSQANLGRARFAGGQASRAEFARAILWETDFTGAMLLGARFADVQALHMKLAGADLSEAVLDGLVLYQTDLSGTRFVNASINETQFLGNTMDGADFTGARGRRAVFLKVRGEGLRFDGADLSESTFVQEPKLPKVSMRGAQLRKVFLHGADLTGADLFQANLDGAELGYSRLQGANLHGATAREAGLRFVDLSGARVVSADLRGALLANAKAFGTRFDRTSFFMSDLSRIRVDTDASFDGVNFGRARRYPRWEPPQP
jgi:uncharacterized protein YjbI with pentapeptide repeats